jgi:hypothetical protein
MIDAKPMILGMPGTFPARFLLLSRAADTMDGFSIVEMNIGPDKVHLVGAHVTIFATRAMPDWTVREFCLPPIYFQGNKYYLRRKLPGPPPYALRYELAPWHSGLGTESSRSITYNEAYVEQRERDFKTGRRDHHLNMGLLPLYPFLGFCWSGFKQRVLGPLGFEPLAITMASIALGLGFFLLEAVFVVGFHMGFIGLILSSERLLLLDRILLLLVPLDCIMRYDHILRGDGSPDGFLEWMFVWLRPGRKER